VSGFVFLILIERSGRQQLMNLHNNDISIIDNPRGGEDAENDAEKDKESYGVEKMEWEFD
jgi:hypothetical protein